MKWLYHSFSASWFYTSQTMTPPTCMAAKGLISFLHLKNDAQYNLFIAEKMFFSAANNHALKAAMSKRFIYF